MSTWVDCCLYVVSGFVCFAVLVVWFDCFLVWLLCCLSVVDYWLAYCWVVWLGWLALLAEVLLCCWFVAN